MRISHRYKFIFFSNPKTGSESLRKLLDPYSDITGVPYWERTPENPFYSHIRPCEVRDLFRERGWDYEGYYRFTFVRNPWARLVSLYEMIHTSKRAGRIGSSRPAALWRNLTGGDPSPAGFRRWVRGIQPDGAGGGGSEEKRWQRYGTYTIRAYAGDESGALIVSRIVRLEDIADQLPVVLREIGLPNADEVAIPRVNVRKHASYTNYYDTATADLVGKLYRDDIESYGYRFGE